MNFLAHLFLSGEEEELLVGNFLGDFVRKSADKNFSMGIQRGLKLHRNIDTFTDAHPVVRASTRLLHSKHHKYSPVLLDIFYDFLLIQNWKLYSEESLENYTQKIYTILEKYLPIMPPTLQYRLPLMIADNWLVQYGTPEGLEFTFNRMKYRASQPDCLDGAVGSLQTHLEALDAGFRVFFRR